jgi:HTH-type transcriptional regulator/antitoxin HigA
MQVMNVFEPAWATPPGATVLDLLQERGLAVAYLAKEVHRDIRDVSLLLYGLAPLDADWAANLSRVLGSTVSFWLRREEQYRADLQRLCSPASAVREWLDELPVRDMVKFGWIDGGRSTDEAVLNACAFLGVATPRAFETRYERLIGAAAYRRSNVFKTNTAAVAAWLRQGEIESASIDCEPWSQSKLVAALPEVRALTRISDPAAFIPALRQLMASCGVAVVVARAPEGCRASGATRFLAANKALIQLSFRYLADDQFWFTVFHEIGHLVLHAHGELFLEGLEERHSQAETEADEFALLKLFEEVGVGALDTVNLTKFDIARLARRAGISPGLVVGQLQDRKRIPYKHFNFLKARYAWQE